MDAVWTEPMTNLNCQHGISMAQTGWMYENMGYPAAATNMYRQAVQTIGNGIATLRGPAPDDALFHLGASQLRLGCLGQALGNADAARTWFEAALPNLREAWQRFPGNPWYQQALAQASLLLGQVGGAQQVRDESPAGSTLDKIGDWIDRAAKIWDRFKGIGQGQSADCGGTLLSDVFGVNPAWTGSEMW